MAEYTMPSSAGGELTVQVAEPADTPRAIIMIAHGYGEHAGRYRHVAGRLTDAGYLVVAPDHHGHGRSSGARGQIDFTRAVADLDALLDHQREIHPDLGAFLIGHSMGGGISLRYAIAHQDRLAGLVLSGPLVVAEANPVSKLVGRLLAAIVPGAPVLSLDAKLVSRDPAVVAAYEADPLVRHGGLPAASAAEFLRHAETIMTDAGAITIPTLLLWGGADRLAPAHGAEQLAASLHPPDLTTRAYPGLYHEIFNEPEQDDILDTVVAWLDERA